MTPPEKVAAAMPGTAADISFATGYPIPEVLRQVGVLRRNGVRVNAVRDPALANVPNHTPGPDMLTTIFRLDDDSREE